MNRLDTQTAAKRRRRLMAVTALLSALTVLGGCASSNKGNVGTHSSATQGVDVVPGTSEARQAVAYWSNAYERDRNDRKAILGFSEALITNEQFVQAKAVLRAGVITHPRDRDIASAYGKVLAMNGQLEESLNVIQQAQDPQKPDWKLLSAEGAVLDQMGRHENARQIYQQALKIVPDDASLLNNLGLSYLLSNQLPEAEYTLRKAAALPTADSRVRQNLALVLGVQGKFDEAEKVATAELDPQEAEANIAYLRSMLKGQG